MNDPRVDAYIANAADFAQPILRHLRAVVHEGCPDVEETIKWGVPAFIHEGMMCGMAAFKEHCVFSFWKWKLVIGDDPKAEEAAGQFGRITHVGDLPPKRVLIGYVKRAAALNEQGVKPVRPARRAARPTKVPDDLARALQRNRKARETFEGFSPSHRNEYVEWITEAKRDETRQKRIAQTLEWLAEGKPRNWKYMK